MPFTHMRSVLFDYDAACVLIYASMCPAAASRAWATRQGPPSGRSKGEEGLRRGERGEETISQRQGGKEMVCLG